MEKIQTYTNGTLVNQVVAINNFNFVGTNRGLDQFLVKVNGVDNFTVIAIGTKNFRYSDQLGFQFPIQ
ncbi:MAG: hypothetical protein IPN72_13010 [Saprospiraceae bacterium]|nr:hypothetical protein [Saprospiraceae bacterium]